MVEPPTDDYDELTVDEVKSRVEGGEEPLDPVEVLDYERENKARVTLIEWLENFTSDWHDEDESVTVAPMRKRRVATYWIDEDDLHEPMTVERTSKIDEAIEAGDLQVIDG